MFSVKGNRVAKLFRSVNYVHM